MSNIVTKDYSDPDGFCECYWRANKCPNKAEFIIKCRNNNGFSIMCEVHKSDYEFSNRINNYSIESYSSEVALKYLEVLKRVGAFGLG